MVLSFLKSTGPPYELRKSQVFNLVLGKTIFRLEDLFFFTISIWICQPSAEVLRPVARCKNAQVAFNLNHRMHWGFKRMSLFFVHLFHPFFPTVCFLITFTYGTVRWFPHPHASQDTLLRFCKEDTRIATPHTCYFSFSSLLLFFQHRAHSPPLTWRRRTCRC